MNTINGGLNPAAYHQQPYQPITAQKAAPPAVIYQQDASLKQASVILSQLMANLAKAIYKFSVGLFFPKAQPLTPKNNPEIHKQIDVLQTNISDQLRDILAKWTKNEEDQNHTYQISFSSLGNPYDFQVTVQKGHDTHHAIMKPLKRWLKDLKVQEVNLQKNNQSINVAFSVKTVSYGKPQYDSAQKTHFYATVSREIEFQGTITKRHNAKPNDLTVKQKLNGKIIEPEIVSFIADGAFED